MLFWFLQQHFKNIVTSEIFKLKAKEIHLNMSSSEEFVRSDKWLKNFKKRHDIRILAISCEKLACNASNFIKKFRKIVQENNYFPDQVYNCDETGLVYKNLSNKLNVYRQELSAPGRKKSQRKSDDNAMWECNWRT